MVSVPFCGPAYQDRTPDANAQECVNFYPMASPTASQPSRVVLYPTPGYLYHSTFGNEVRGLYVINDNLFAVAGGTLYSVSAAGAATAVGALITNTGRVSIACNTVELVISDDSYGYAYNLSSGAFSLISGGSWPASGGVTNVAQMDGYVLAALNGSKTIIQSDILAGGTYGAQAFATVTSFPDSVVAVYSDELQLYVFGPNVTEVRFNSGATPFAFEKTPGVLIQAGCAAKHSVARVGGTVMWLATDVNGKAYVAALEGYTPRVVSTPPMNEAFERYPFVSDAYGLSYREADNLFYVLTFPAADATWAYDTKMNMWHRRSIGVAGGRDLPTHCVNWQGGRIVGGTDGKLYWMSQDYLTDGRGNGLRRVRATEHVSADGRPSFLKELEVQIEAGVGLPAGQGSAPLATLEVSKDGGNTWTNVGTGSMGAMGAYRTRLIWRNLGWAWNWTFRIVITDPVRAYILGANGRFIVGTK